jgi:hypothetical protein
MPILVTCPHCSARLNAPDAAAGRQVKCSRCGQILPVPGAEAPETSPITPAGEGDPPPTPGPQFEEPYIQTPPLPSYRPEAIQPPPLPVSPQYSRDRDYRQEEPEVEEFDDRFGRHFARERRLRSSDDYDSDETRPIVRYHPNHFRALFRFGLICLFVALGLIVIAAGLIGGALLTYPPGSKANPNARQTADLIAALSIPVFGLAGVALIVMQVFFYILLYKAWNQIQDGHAQTSPGQAVGFLFIPFFNLYWVFVAYRGLAVDMNHYARRHDLDIPPVSDALVMAWCILLVCCAVPCVNYLVLLPAMAFFFVAITVLKNGAAAIAEAQQETAPPPRREEEDW